MPTFFAGKRSRSVTCNIKPHDARPDIKLRFHPGRGFVYGRAAPCAAGPLNAMWSTPCTPLPPRHLLATPMRTPACPHGAGRIYARSSRQRHHRGYLDDGCDVSCGAAHVGAGTVCIRRIVADRRPTRPTPYRFALPSGGSLNKRCSSHHDARSDARTVGRSFAARSRRSLMPPGDERAGN